MRRKLDERITAAEAYSRGYSDGATAMLENLRRELERARSGRPFRICCANNPAHLEGVE